MINKPAIVFVPFILAGACGTGGGSLDPLSYDELSASLATLESDTLFTDPTDDATVNALSGSVTYNGVIDIAVDQPGATAPLTGRQYLGEIEMTVNFVDGPDAMTGTADNFFFYGIQNSPPVDGTAVEGNLDIAGSTNATDNFFSGTASGEVEGVNAGGLFYGRFSGTNAEGMSLTFQLGGTGSGSAFLID
jgi:hypothetical protein